jgi:hypothetical protein
MSSRDLPSPAIDLLLMVRRHGGSFWSCPLRRCPASVETRLCSYLRTGFLRCGCLVCGVVCGVGLRLLFAASGTVLVFKPLPSIKIRHALGVSPRKKKMCRMQTSSSPPTFVIDALTSPLIPFKRAKTVIPTIQPMWAQLNQQVNSLNVNPCLHVKKKKTLTLATYAIFGQRKMKPETAN